MNAREAIKQSMNMPDMIWKSYLSDLSAEDLLVRPVDGANHIAWQLGHLISSEHKLMESVCPGSMPPLPDGFAEKYTNDTCGSDDPADFLEKADYIQLAEGQRAGTLAALDTLSDEGLDAPSPESLQMLGSTVAAIVSMQATHWTMHSGQWAVIRRKLGRAPLF
jgi:uncharacterized damage-inducible protein DinB